MMIVFVVCNSECNHNIDVKKDCSKCHRNKYSQEEQIKLEIKEKNKEYNWKCYYCKYTNKYLK